MSNGEQEFKEFMQYRERQLKEALIEEGGLGFRIAIYKKVAISSNK
ncbi:hypothetical protein [Defluviitalea raffinosedens]|nr:hypothetical protein [Defluviitalea raffinosedens]MBM7686677.1 hypothetical protein [Defluviitalea raffinosedens]HHW66434.1 hypothetical protein [Candidatus Epulonipiscium sp.]